MSFHKAAKGDTCANIIPKHKTFDFGDFFKWNPAVGKDCTSLLVNYYVYVSVEGWKPSTTTAKASTTTKAPSNRISTPTSIQAGIVSNCNKFHLVSTTTLTSIQNHYKITIADFAKWNPVVGSKCTALWAN
ncbi:hypothetical protein N0V84_009480 [Fusarium piperis]|uniref:LysM domain-containing protein n=1 Tax=Fusarium piperis TaxID=1435070 RepID=A0A9W9BI32_9HYPO|nr:hypothetical protein N0V84_009480 [Fusarium piperis]